MFKEYDVIIAAVDIDDRILKGYPGTILIIYDPTNFEVEFFDKEGESLGTKTVSIDKIKADK